MPNISGKYMKGRIGASVITGLIQSTWTEQGDKLDATDAEDDGIASTDVGVKGLTLSIRGIHKVGSGMFSLVYTGAEINSVKIYLSGLTGPYLNAPKLVVTRVEQPIEVRGRIEYSFEAESKGLAYVWTLPAS